MKNISIKNLLVNDSDFSLIKDTPTYKKKLFCIDCKIKGYFNLPKGWDFQPCFAWGADGYLTRDNVKKEIKTVRKFLFWRELVTYRITENIQLLCPNCGLRGLRTQPNPTEWTADDAREEFEKESYNTITRQIRANNN